MLIIIEAEYNCFWVKNQLLMNKHDVLNKPNIFYKSNMFNKQGALNCYPLNNFHQLHLVCYN